MSKYRRERLRHSLMVIGTAVTIGHDLAPVEHFTKRTNEDIPLAIARSWAHKLTPAWYCTVYLLLKFGQLSDEFTGLTVSICNWIDPFKKPKIIMTPSVKYHQSHCI